jgi:hypothetical protein
MAMVSVSSSIKPRVRGDRTRGDTGNKSGDGLDLKPNVGASVSGMTSLVDSNIVSIQSSGTKAGG